MSSSSSSSSSGGGGVRREGDGKNWGEKERGVNNRFDLSRALEAASVSVNVSERSKVSETTPGVSNPPFSFLSEISALLPLRQSFRYFPVFIFLFFLHPSRK